ncbi:sodium-dependent glucose transporter 1-like protein [Dinothrombium tinctorium]|uniref:Sodium-dependent glucose transporter 1-like protein n=1 Tax=Dinothrombium tinctorium TaxID=1965070 RepID=A0A443QZ14_9ACAR|nr:sodium-dependent glucose transporter 1-like protein [Dinothrombium tinctorium]
MCRSDLQLEIWPLVLAHCCVTGTVLNFFNTQFIFAAFILIEGISTGILPNTSSLILYNICNGIIGLSCGAIEAVSFANVVSIWKEKSGPAAQAVGLSINIANVVSPLLFKPFLLPAQTPQHIEYCGNHLNVTSTNSTVEKGEEKTSRIWIPHASISVTMVVISLLVVILECYRLKKDKKKVSEKRDEEEGERVRTESTNESTNKGFKFKEIFFTTICCLVIAVFWAFVCSFLQFWVPFVIYSESNVSYQTTAFMMSAFSLATAIGGFVGLLASITVPPFKMLTVLMAIIIVGHLVLLIGSSHSEAVLWVGGLLQTLCFGNFYVSVYNLLQETAGINNLKASLYTMSAYLLTAIGVPILIANFIECTPSIFLHYNSFSIVVVTVLLAIIGAALCTQKREVVEERPKGKFQRKYSSRRVSVAGVAL